MQNQFYVEVGKAFPITAAFQDSASDNTVSIVLRRASDGYYYDFTNEAWQAESVSGSLTYDFDILFKVDFTPPSAGTYTAVITNETLDVKEVVTLIARGAAVPSGLTGSELTTLENVREFLAIPTAQTGDDNMLTNIITRVSTDIEKLCGRTFAEATYTEYHDGDGTSNVMLDQYPVSSITSLYDDPDLVYDSDHLIPSDSYIIDEEAGIVRLVADAFSIGVNSIKVTYVAGYSTIPADLEHACILLVAREYLLAKPTIGDKDTQSIRRKEMKEEAEAIIARHKKTR